MSRPLDDLVATPISRDAVRVSGEDSITFLQGQLSQDIEALAVNASTWSFVLQPQGKVDAWVGVARLSDDELVLDVDAGFGDALLARLERFKLRVKVEQVLVDGVTALAVRGGDADQVAVVGDEPKHRYVRQADWPDLPGVDVLAIGELHHEKLRGPAGDDVRAISADEYDALRIAHGVPAMGSEITDKTIPAELGQWVIDASVSFTKGCFTGQELVARIDSRGGNVPRHLCVVSIETDVVPPVGATLAVNETAAGALTSVAPSASHGGAVALAFVPRSVERPVPASLSWDGGSAPARIG